jgi:hypothetical protein
MDLFATEKNKKTMLVYTWIPSQLAYAVDALGTVLHPEPEKLNLAAWMLLTDCCQKRDCLRKLERFSKPLGVWEQGKTIVSNLNNFFVLALHNKLIRMNHLKKIAFIL